MKLFIYARHKYISQERYFGKHSSTLETFENKSKASLLSLKWDPRVETNLPPRRMLLDSSTSYIGLFELSRELSRDRGSQMSFLA